LVTARAVAPLTVLLEYALPLLAPGGYFLAYKGPEAQAELDAAQHALLELGGCRRKELSRELRLSFGERRLLVVEKVADTADKYPRRAGMAVKRPL
jgi:16S rRNA (guanine527-N7)-methyltransferase